ncbi:ABC transporter permease [Dactylosporangium sp. NPDC049742]|uniref:ABC transporter permease n=1 Tax=Dactylosporangium sp. NPDC049742 TaxID=3154737 RepID=UPI00341DA670
MSSLTQRRSVVEHHDGSGSTSERGGGISGMLWLTWRQHRWALLGSLILTAVLAGWLLYLSSDMINMYNQCKDIDCPRSSPEGAALFGDYGPIRQAELLGVVLRYVPLLIGLFLGVPVLAREHEQRTLLLAWSQDSSPMRWLWSKLAVLGLFVAAMTTVLSLVSERVADSYTTVVGGGLFRDSIFLVTGMLPLAGGLCWFAVGVALGAVTKRTLPAMFATLVGFIGVMLAVQWRYPNLMQPKSMYWRMDQPPSNELADPNVLVLTNNVLIGGGQVENVFDAPGHPITFADLQRMCPDANLDNPPAAEACMLSNHLLTFATYQPSDRIPVFHLIIAGGYVGLAVVALVAVWMIVRRTDLSAG